MLQCNEAKPTCANCARLEVACTYPHLPSWSFQSSATASPTSGAPVPPATGIASPTHTPLAVADLELLYNYLRGDAFDIARGEREKVLRDRYVQTGFSFAYVLHSILAVSAIELAIHNPDRQAEMLVLGTRHRTASLRLATPHIADMKEDHALPLFVFSGMASIYAHAEALLKTTSEKNGSDDPIDGLVTCFELSRGIPQILEPHKHVVMNSWASPILNVPEWRAMLHNENRLDAMIPPLADFRRLIMKNFQSAGDRNQVMESAQQLIAALAMNMEDDVDTNESHILVQMWQASMPDTVLNMIKTHCAVGLVFLLYYAALMGSRAKLWWLHPWRFILLRAIREQLPVEYSQHMDWVEELISKNS